MPEPTSTASMTDEHEYAKAKHAQYVAERSSLIEAARESARTFDNAVLAFGAAIFGASVAFLKDVAPKPQHYTLKWLAAAWTCFSLGLLFALCSYLYSHQACMFAIEENGRVLDDANYKHRKNTFARLTNWCNYLSVASLFLGLVMWAIFALENLKG
jgi:hypothetical protein